ncbi:hypothetical protein ACA910_008277 [Epithemia clementina (nom. ined.)]
MTTTSISNNDHRSSSRLVKSREEEAAAEVVNHHYNKNAENGGSGNSSSGATVTTAATHSNHSRTNREMTTTSTTGGTTSTTAPAPAPATPETQVEQQQLNETTPTNKKQTNADAEMSQKNENGTKKSDPPATTTAATSTTDTPSDEDLAAVAAAAARTADIQNIITSKGRSTPSSTSPSSPARSWSTAHACTMFKEVYSTILLIFSIVIVIALIFNDQTALSQDVHAAFAFVVLWIAILWLSMVEGGQGALVGLAPVQKSLYETTHPRSYQITTLAHRGNHLDRYLIGRQFLVILLVFVVNQCGAPVGSDARLPWNWSEAAQEVFVRSSLAIILVTAMMGQLHSQVNAANCMLDYINNRFMLFTLRVSLALEASGAMHAVYLLQYGFAKMSRNNYPLKSETEELDDFAEKDDDAEGAKAAAGVPKKEPEDPEHKALGTERTTKWQEALFWGRVIFSVALLGFSFAVTLTALFNEQTNMWSGVPPYVSVILFFSFMIVLGILEGTQIAVFAVSRLPMEELARHPKNVLRCIDILLIQNDGQNIPRFMIGRQIMVTLLTFIIARVTTVNVDTESGDEDTIWGVPKGLQEFFNTGLLGAIIVTLVGSISWKLMGSAFPVIFLSNPMVYILIQVALGLEASGICSGAWVLAAMHRKCAGFQPDETYVGTPEDRAAAQKPDSMRDVMSTGGRSTSTMNLREPMNQCGSSRYLQADEVSRSSSRYLMRGMSAGSSLGDNSSSFRKSNQNKNASSAPDGDDDEEKGDKRKTNDDNDEDEDNKGNNSQRNYLPKYSRSLSHRIQQGEDMELEIELENPSDLETDDEDDNMEKQQQKKNRKQSRTKSGQYDDKEE